MDDLDSRDGQHLSEEYETLLETVDDGIFFVSVEPISSGYNFEYKRINHAFEEITGIATTDIHGQNPIEVFGEELGTTLRTNYLRCVNQKQSLRYEEQLDLESGPRFWQTTLTPVIPDDEVVQIIGITRNVTDRVKRERQLRSQKEQLDDFAGVVSHDIRNPLNVAQGRLEILQAECESDHIAPIVRSLDRIEELVADTLTLARQGQVVADPEPIDLLDIVGGCWKNISAASASLEVTDDLTIIGDRSRLQHVFENLFRNAIEHGGSDVTVRVGQFAPYGIYVENDGPPIPEEKREAVFEPGHSSASGGTGFGLTIVKRIAEAHGWQVKIAEGTDGGTRFEFTNVEVLS